MTIVINGTVTPSRQDYAAAGKYFTASNPTPGTAIQCGTVTAFSATADGLFTLSNGNAPGGASIRLDYLTLNMTGTAPTATTVMKMAFFNETGIVAPSGGNSAVVPRNVLSGGAASAGSLNVFVNAMCTIPAAAAGAVRTLLGNVSIPTNLGITGDTYVVTFGGDPMAGGGNQTAVRVAATAARFACSTVPIIIPPQNTLIADWWWIGQATSGPLFEYEIGYIETV